MATLLLLHMVVMKVKYKSESDIHQISVPWQVCERNKFHLSGLNICACHG